jgi:hypothetical protein
MTYILLTLVSMVVIIVPLLAWIHEIIEWNHGICKQTNKPWMFQFCDSQGGRTYASLGISMTVTYPYVDR